MLLRSVMFDLDGTITRPLLDFPRIKRDMGLPVDALILESLAGMTDDERNRAMEILENHERLAAEKSQLNDGAPQLLQWLADHGLCTGIITRNSRRSVETVLRLHGLSFDVIISREDAAPKPSPEGLHKALNAVGCPAENAVYVGDHAIDVAAGRAAGTRTIRLLNNYGRHGTTKATVDSAAAGHYVNVEPDWTAAGLHEVLEIIRHFYPPEQAVV